MMIAKQAARIAVQEIQDEFYRQVGPQRHHEAVDLDRACRSGLRCRQGLDQFQVRQP